MGNGEQGTGESRFGKDECKKLHRLLKILKKPMTIGRLRGGRASSTAPVMAQGNRESEAGWVHEQEIALLIPREW